MNSDLLQKGDRVTFWHKIPHNFLKLLTYNHKCRSKKQQNKIFDQEKALKYSEHKHGLKDIQSKKLACKKYASRASSGDKRFKILDATMKRHQYQQNALIEVLHKAQELFGHLEHDLLVYIAHNLKLPPSRVYGVATFYHFFSLAPKGVHSCVICTGTACYVKDAANLLATVEKCAQIHVGETTSDGEVSLSTARCLGACGIAPAVVFDGTVCGHQTPELVTEQIEGCLKHGSN